MERGARDGEIDHAGVDVHLRMRPQQREQVVDHRPAGVHDPHAQARMLDQRRFQLQRAAQPRAVRLHLRKVRRARRSRPHVDSHRHVQLLGHRKIRLESRIRRRDAGVLDQHFRERAITAVLQLLADGLGLRPGLRRALAEHQRRHDAQRAGLAPLVEQRPAG